MYLHFAYSKETSEIKMKFVIVNRRKLEKPR